MTLLKTFLVCVIILEKGCFIVILNRIVKIASGAFLNYYHLYYTNTKGHNKIYEIISRDKNLKKEDMNKKESQAVILVVFNKEHDKILLNKEFRMAVNDYIYNMPAGLIENGETVEEASRRELWEETGLSLVKIIDVLAPTYSSVGISNEMTKCVFCEADGELGGHPEEDEEIEPKWFTKEEVRQILEDKELKENYAMAARTQMLCYLWINKI